MTRTIITSEEDAARWNQLRAAYDAGYKAGSEQQPRRSNPYEPGSDEHKAWADGWDVGDADLRVW